MSIGFGGTGGLGRSEDGSNMEWPSRRTGKGTLLTSMGFCYKFKSRKLKRQNLIKCNHETMYITVVLSFYIAAFFTCIFFGKQKE